jgi:hypothetical protein
MERAYQIIRAARSCPPISRRARDTRQRLGDLPYSHIGRDFRRFAGSEAKIYVNQSKEKIAVITSHNGAVKRVVIPQPGFPYLD